MTRLPQIRFRRGGVSAILVLICCLILVSVNTWASCSSYYSRATINEVHQQGNTERFVEVKLLDTSITSTAYDSWRLRLCNSSGSCSGNISLAGANDSNLPWIVVGISQISNWRWIDLANGMSALLTDSSGKTIDYLSVGGYLGQQDTSCTPAYDWDMSKTNSHTIMRIPDGTGDWMLEGPGGSIDPTEENSNDDTVPPDGGTLSRLDIQGVTVAQGEPAQFILTLLDGPKSYDVGVDFTTINGTAFAGSDYVAQSGRATIPAGATQLTITVTTLPRTLSGESYFYLFLENPDYATLVNHFGICTIAGSVTEWRFDECEYTGASGEVQDSLGLYNATARYNATTEEPGVMERFVNLTSNRQYLATSIPLTNNWTVATWALFPITTTHQYHVLASIAGGGDLLFADRSRSFQWGVYTANPNNITYGTFRLGTLSAGWHHLTIVGELGQTRLYIDGVLRDTVAKQVKGQLTYVGTSYDGVNTSSSQGFGTALDEMLVYNSALSLARIQALYDRQLAGVDMDGTARAAVLCGASIDHFRIEHDGHGLTCQPEAVTVRACLDSGCTTEYTDAVEVTLSPTGWVGGDVQTINGGSGVFSLRHVQVESVTLDATSSAPAPANPSECFVAGVAGSCDVMFHASGFLFQIPDFEACQGTGSATLQAVQLDDTTQTCVAAEGFGGQTKSVSFWSSYSNPASGSRSVQVEGSIVAGSSPGTSIAVTFDPTATAQLDINYADAGQMQLDASYLGSGDDAGLELTGNATFISYPNRLAVQATSDGTTSLANSASSGLPHWPAGDDFQIRVQGVCQDGAVTPNFAWATTLAASAPYEPASGVLGSLQNGSIALADFSSGSATVTDAQYSEVGNFTLQASAIDYLAPGIDILGSGGVVGRFTPHHFSVSLNTPSFATTNNGFTYIGEPFGYANAPVITVTAENKQNIVTSNYTDGWWKLFETTLSGYAYSAAAGSLDTALVPDPGVAEIAGTGSGTITFSSGGGMAFQRSVPVAPFDAEISLQINVQDSDGIAYASNPVSFGAASAGSGIAFDDGKEMRYGRLAMTNAYGSELLDLPVPFFAEYFNGLDFVTNTADSSTPVSIALLSLTGTTSSTPSFAAATLIGGDGGLVLSAPGEGNEGYLDLGTDLTLFDWLRYDWENTDGLNNGPYDDNPSCRATFGIYKGSPRLIYQRESVD